MRGMQPDHELLHYSPPMTRYSPSGCLRLPFSREVLMITHVDVDVQQLWRDYRAEPTVEMRNQLVELYLPLVKYNAERIWSRLPEGVELDDLISAGVFGLMDAIDAFDLERGVKFETYCVPRIRGAMLDELRTMDWVPRLVRSKASKLEEARKTLEAALGRPPRSDEMAQKLGITLEEFEKMSGDATAVWAVHMQLRARRGRCAGSGRSRVRSRRSCRGTT